MCKMQEITRTVSGILHVFDPALPHFTQTRFKVDFQLLYYLESGSQLSLKLLSSSEMNAPKHCMVSLWNLL